MTKPYVWDSAKNTKLIESRGLDFREIVAALGDGKLLGSIPHHNPEFSHQRILYIALKGDVVVVPSLETADHIVLKTAYFSRKARKHFLGL